MAVIETVQARADISTWHGTGMDLVCSLDDPVRMRGLWGHGPGGAAVVKGARVDLRVKPVGVGKTKGRMQVVVTANLTKLLYGPEAKALSLPPRDVAAGVDEMLRVSRRYLPTLAPSLAAGWKIGRVDANATWDVPEADAMDLLNAAGAALWSWDGSGRMATTSQGGRYSWLHQSSKQEQVAVYCKSSESDVWLSPDSRLIRVESRVMGGKARREYGDTLADLTERGAVVGKGKVEAWTDKIGRSYVGGAMTHTFEALVKAGMEPGKAADMLGPCVLLGQYGVKGCVETLGIPQGRVYRWARTLRDSGTRAEELAGGYGVLLDPDDATFADEHYPRLPAESNDAPATHGLAAATPGQPALSAHQDELVPVSGVTAPWDQS